MVDRLAFLSADERGSTQRDPGMGHVIAGAGRGERVPGGRGEFVRTAAVAIMQHKLSAGVPDLRTLEGLLNADRELLSLGKIILSFFTIACSEPRPSQRMQTLHDTTGISHLAPQPKGHAMIMLGTGPVLFRFSNASDIGEDRGVDHPITISVGHALQEFQRITKPRFCSLDTAA